MLISVIGLFIGIFLGIHSGMVFPAGYSAYVAIGILACLDSVLGGIYARMKSPLGKFSSEKQDEIFRVQSEIIRKLAAKESCVIVGRCAEYVLSDFKNCFNIFLNFFFYSAYPS